MEILNSILGEIGSQICLGGGGGVNASVMIIFSLLNSKIFLISYFLIISFPILFNLGRIRKAGGDFIPPPNSA